MKVLSTISKWHRWVILYLIHGWANKARLGTVVTFFFRNFGLNSQPESPRPNKQASVWVVEAATRLLLLCAVLRAFVVWCYLRFSSRVGNGSTVINHQLWTCSETGPCFSFTLLLLLRLSLSNRPGPQKTLSSWDSVASFLDVQLKIAHELHTFIFICRDIPFLLPLDARWKKLWVQKREKTMILFKAWRPQVQRKWLPEKKSSIRNLPRLASFSSVKSISWWSQDGKNYWKRLETTETFFKTQKV